jgi:hypothetical protein
MNDTTRLEIRPEVLAFVAQVRSRLGDLSPEDRDDLTEGLAADLSDLVEEQGTDVLGDPAAYATELRLAAGLTETTDRRSRRTTRQGFAAWLDGNRAYWDRLVQRPSLAPAWELAVAVRPAWWVLRAWVALGFGLFLVGHERDIAVIPEPGDEPVLGFLALVVAVVLSAQIGRGKLWPGREGDPGPLGGRLLLVGLNLFAVLLVPVMLNMQVTESQAQRWYGAAGWQAVERTPGLRVDGHEVGNVFAYNNKGRPLTGVQLFDEKGRPVSVDPHVEGNYLTPAGMVTAYPWLNGSQELWNVFPLPVREQRSARRPDGAWTSTDPPAVPESPMVVVPPVTLPSPESTDGTTDRSPGAGKAGKAGKTEKTGKHGRSGGRGR